MIGLTGVRNVGLPRRSKAGGGLVLLPAKNANGTFETWPSGTYPTGYSTFSNEGVVTKITGADAKDGTNSLQQEATVAGTVYGFTQNSNTAGWTGGAPGNPLMLEAVVTLDAGTFEGAGLLFRWTRTATSTFAGLSFSVLEPSPVIGQTYTFRGTVVDPSAAAPELVTLGAFFPVTNYGSFGIGPLTAKTITWHSVAVRPVS